MHSAGWIQWDEADWVSTGALVDRMNFALNLAANRLPGITVDWAPELDMSVLDSDAPAKQVIPTPESEEARLEPMLVPGGVSATTRSAALEEFQKQIGQMRRRFDRFPSVHPRSQIRDLGHPHAGIVDRLPTSTSGKTNCWRDC